MLSGQMLLVRLCVVIFDIIDYTYVHNNIVPKNLVGLSKNYRLLFCKHNAGIIGHLQT